MTYHQRSQLQADCLETHTRGPASIDNAKNSASRAWLSSLTVDRCHGIANYPGTPQVRDY
jgi:hypothetical protein